MLPYLFYRALADEHTRDLVAAARRHELIAATTHGSRHTTERASRLKDMASRMVFLLNGIRRSGAPSTVTSSRAGSTLTSTSLAGPVGCSA